MKAGLRHRKRKLRLSEEYITPSSVWSRNVSQKALIMYLLVVVVSLLLSSVPTQSRPVEVRTEKWKIILSSATVSYWKQLFIFTKSFDIHVFKIHQQDLMEKISGKMGKMLIKKKNTNLLLCSVLLLIYWFMSRVTSLKKMTCQCQL